MDHGIHGELRLASVGECDVARRSAHVEGYDVVVTAALPTASAVMTPAAGPKYGPNRIARRDVGGDDAPIALGKARLCADSDRSQTRSKPVEIVLHHRAERRIYGDG